MGNYSKELFLSKSALALYVKARGKDFLDADDLNFIIENNPELIMTILDENGLSRGKFRSLLMSKGRIGVDVIQSSYLFAAWVLGAELKSLGCEVKKQVFGN